MRCVFEDGAARKKKLGGVVLTSPSYLTDPALLYRNNTDQDRAHHAPVFVQPGLGIVIFASHERDPVILFMPEDCGNIGRGDLPVLLHLIDINLPIGMDIDVVPKLHALNV